jgi:hypothetical protein
VPKTDPQVQRLLTAREDIFDRYTEEDLRIAFAEAGLNAVQVAPVGSSGRVLYLFRA